MKGGFVHTRVLIAPCADTLRRDGASVRLEFPAGPGRTGGAVDLFAELHGLRVVVEAERSTARVGNDVRKAKRLGADLLLIVVPTWPLARAVARRVAAEGGGSDSSPMRIFCLPLGAALERLRNIGHLRTARNVGATLNQQSRPAAGDLEIPQ